MAARPIAVRMAAISKRFGGVHALRDVDFSARSGEIQALLGENLEILTREFDRLHDPYIREYWFGKFKEGARWPEPI